MEKNDHNHRPAYTATLDGYVQAFERFQQRKTPEAHDLWTMWCKALEAQVDQPDGIELGAIEWSDQAEEAFQRGEHHPAEFLIRHKYKDFGNLSAADKQRNLRSIPARGWVVSRYETRTRESLWVATQPGWTATRLQLEGER